MLNLTLIFHLCPRVRNIFRVNTMRRVFQLVAASVSHVPRRASSWGDHSNSDQKFCFPMKQNLVLARSIFIWKPGPVSWSDVMILANVLRSPCHPLSDNKIDVPHGSSGGGRLMCTTLTFESSTSDYLSRPVIWTYCLILSRRTAFENFLSWTAR
jgi:hypothetical protein